MYKRQLNNPTKLLLIKVYLLYHIIKFSYLDIQTVTELHVKLSQALSDNTKGYMAARGGWVWWNGWDCSIMVVFGGMTSLSGSLWGWKTSAIQGHSLKILNPCLQHVLPSGTAVKESSVELGLNREVVFRKQCQLCLKFCC